MIFVVTILGIDFWWVLAPMRIPFWNPLGVISIFVRDCSFYNFGDGIFLDLYRKLVENGSHFYWPGPPTFDLFQTLFFDRCGAIVRACWLHFGAMLGASWYHFVWFMVRLSISIFQLLNFSISQFSFLFCSLVKNSIYQFLNVSFFNLKEMNATKEENY